MNSNVPTRTARLTCGTRRSSQSMNHMIQNASSATARCKKFIQFQVSNSRVLGFTRQIIKATRPTQGLQNIGSDLRFYHSVIKSKLTGLVLSGLEPIRGSERAASRIARSVAIAIGISLSIGITPADGGSTEAIQPKDYVRLALDKREAQCLSKLIGKESAWNSKAVGNLNSPSKSYTYGLLQLKNPIAKDLTAIEQIHLGLKYIDHRYQGDTCKAWSHWLRKGWH